MEKKQKKVVKVFTLNSVSYLGTRCGSIITGIQVPLQKNLPDNHFAEYIKAKQIDELVSMNSGLGTDIMTRPLNKKEVLSFKTVKAQYKTAKKMADGWLINQVFDEFRSEK